VAWPIAVIREGVIMMPKAKMVTTMRRVRMERRANRARRYVDHQRS
jgi:hypothetical protein